MKNNRRAPLPEDFALTAADIMFFQTRNPAKDLGEQFERFKYHHQARGTRFVDWRAAWRTWSMNCSKFEQHVNLARQIGAGHMGPGMANLMRMYKEATEREISKLFSKRENGQCEPISHAVEHYRLFKPHQSSCICVACEDARHLDDCGCGDCVEKAERRQ